MENEKVSGVPDERLWAGLTRSGALYVIAWGYIFGFLQLDLNWNGKGRGSI